MPTRSAGIRHSPTTRGSPRSAAFCAGPASTSSQLFNVLRGDISLVGPRPDVPAQRVFDSQEEFAKRHSVRPASPASPRSEALSRIAGRTQKARPRICRQAQSRFRPADMREDGHEAVRPERQLNPCAGSLDITTGRVCRWNRKPCRSWDRRSAIVDPTIGACFTRTAWGSATIAFGSSTWRGGTSPSFQKTATSWSSRTARSTITSSWPRN